MTMAMGNYRRVLGLPGVRTLLLLTFASRIPAAATNMVLTLHVVLTLHRDYGSAGLVGAAGTIGIAIGAPLTGRLVDALGVRKMVTITTVIYATYWLTAWLLPYTGLLVAAFVSGVFAMPVMSIGRQALAALVPTEHRRAAYSLDSISLEMTFMVGPALGVLIATKVSTTAAVISVGVMLVASGIALFVVNPPVRGAHEPPSADAVRPPRREWIRAPMLVGLITGCGAVFILAGTEVTIVAALRTTGEVGLTGVVIITMCIASAVGGIVYGALHRTPGPLMLMTLLGLLVVPVGLVGGQWWVLCLALIPTNLMCAPTLSSTADRISRVAPAAVRGEAMGLHSSALTLGGALGSPIVGTVVDHWNAIGGFAAAGLGGVLIGALALPFVRQRPVAVEPSEQVMAVSP